MQGLRPAFCISHDEIVGHIQSLEHCNTGTAVCHVRAMLQNCFMQEDPVKVERLLKIACDMFKTVLERDEHNLFAAHGIAAVLAEQATRAEPPRLEYLQAAKKVFDKVSLLLSQNICVHEGRREILPGCDMGLLQLRSH